MSTVDLNPVSYLVLGLVRRDEPCTPYDLKGAVARGVAGFWPFQHSQLYSEPERLAAAGLLEEERELDGRRRRLYRITAAGRKALESWLAEPSQDPPQMRSLGLLKLYFAGFADQDDINALALAQSEVHEARIASYAGMEQRLVELGDRPYQIEVLRIVREMDRAAAAAWLRLVRNDGPSPMAAVPRLGSRLRDRRTSRPVSAVSSMSHHSPRRS